MSKTPAVTRAGTLGMVGVLETGGGTCGAWETETVYTGVYGMVGALRQASVASWLLRYRCTLLLGRRILCVCFLIVMHSFSS